MKEWRARLEQLHNILKVFPGDIGARSELAAILEQMGEAEGALYNWRRVLAYDPNNLRAWEGIARYHYHQHTDNPVREGA